MGFMTGKTLPENVALTGSNAPREVIRREALRVARPATHTTPNNAKAQNYRGVMAGAKDVTAIQAAFVNAIARNKNNGKTNPGRPSWAGKLFGG